MFHQRHLCSINATYVPDSFLGSCNTITGSYDGLIGDLESNLTDFSVLFNSNEAIADPRCGIPVELNALYQQQNSYIVSSSDTNVTKSIKHIHETTVSVRSLCDIFPEHALSAIGDCIEKISVYKSNQGE